MKVTVFYAWQSDSPETHNHYLIRNAARDACERITEDASNDWEVTLDHDTKDIPGMCDIPNTILTKIRNCDIFLADLTLVGKTAVGKLLPNSNVIFELGYAARQLGFKALVAVFNEAFGKVEAQVFDVKRRKGLKYSTAGAKSKADLKKVTDKLSKDLEDIIRGTIKTVVLPKQNKSAAGDAEAAETRRTVFAQRVLAGQFHGLRERPAVLTSVFFAPHGHLEYEKIGGIVREQFHANPSIDSDSYAWASNSSICEFSLSGHFHRACTRDYKSLVQRLAFLGRGGGPAGDDRFLSAQPLQGNIVNGGLAITRFLASLKIKPPWQIAISLAGVKGYSLLDERNQASPREFRDDILPLPIQRVSAAAQVADPLAVGTLLKPALDYLMRSAGWEFNWCYTESGIFTVRNF